MHFTLRLSGLSLFAIKCCQAKVRLRRERALLLNGKKFGPSLLGCRGVTFERSRFPQRIEGFRHFRQQSIGPQKFRARLMRLTLLEQSVAQTVGGFSVAGLEFDLQAKFFLRFRPLESSGINFASAR